MCRAKSVGLRLTLRWIVLIMEGESQVLSVVSVLHDISIDIVIGELH